jgi:hypothetical protein
MVKLQKQHSPREGCGIIFYEDDVGEKVAEKPFSGPNGHSRGSGNPVFSIPSGLPLWRE